MLLSRTFWRVFGAALMAYIAGWYASSPGEVGRDHWVDGLAAAWFVLGACLALAPKDH